MHYSVQIYSQIIQVVYVSQNSFGYLSITIDLFSNGIDLIYSTSYKYLHFFTYLPNKPII